MKYPLNVFYGEPDPDRWFLYDRYPRRVIRRIVRGKSRPGGQKMVFINLVKGLRKIGVPYRINNFRYISRHTNEPACIIGKSHMLFNYDWKNPIILGSAGSCHPVDCQGLLERYVIRKILVPGPWVYSMFKPFYGDRLKIWPVGIDTEYWAPRNVKKSIDVLVYDKIYWKRDIYEDKLIDPIVESIRRRGLTVETIRYGLYKPEELNHAVQRCRSAIFLSRHETQGLAYQQILSAGVPVFAWDPGGFWEDPEYYPDRVKFRPVSSVPYWDERCGMKFEDAHTFESRFDQFYEGVKRSIFCPRDYILDNLTLEKCASQYIDIVRSL